MEKEKEEGKESEKMKSAIANVIELVKRINERVDVVERRTTESESELSVALNSPSGPLLSLVTTMNALDTRLSGFINEHKNDMLVMKTELGQTEGKIIRVDDLGMSVDEIRSQFIAQKHELAAVKRSMEGMIRKLNEPQ